MTIAAPEKPALKLAQRQKRLLFFRRQLAHVELDRAVATEVEELLGRYGQIINFMSGSGQSGTPTPDSSAGDLEKEAQAIERRLQGLFEARRLSTSTIGSRDSVI